MAIRDYSRYKNIRNLSRYKEEDLEVLLLYNRIGNPIQPNLVGAHFILGKLLDISEHHISFNGPNGITPLGVKYDGSPYEINFKNTILIIPVNDIITKIPIKQHEYKFSTMYGVPISTDEKIIAPDPIEGFMMFANMIPSIASERRKGYTTPIKLEKTLDIYAEPKNSIHLATSEFSRDMRVSGSLDFASLGIKTMPGKYTRRESHFKY